jgi:succinyl-CoA synthetase beta subunit
MKIHEYQAKEIFSRYKIPVTKEILCHSVDEVEAAAEKLELPVVVKAQVLTGGRGKAGGVKLCKTVEEAREAGLKILDMNIKGYTVEKVLVAQGLRFSSEFYVGLTIDRTSKSVILMASREGGVEIEEVAVNNPGAILKYNIDAELGLPAFMARKVRI